MLNKSTEVRIYCHFHQRRSFAAGAFTALLAALVLLSFGMIAENVTAQSPQVLPIATAPITSKTSTTLVGKEASGGRSKITTALLEQLDGEPNAQMRYLVMLAEQPDTSNNIIDWNAKGKYVYDISKQVADRTQPIVERLLTRHQAEGNVRRYKSYLIINAFGVEGNLASAYAVAALPEVGSLDLFPNPKIVDESNEPEGTPPPSATPCQEPCQSRPSSNQWNVELVHAPQAWEIDCNGLPCKGMGITIGSIDTGAFYTHEALAGKYRGNMGGGNFDHRYNWWDATNGTPIPYDDDGHGTHTIGTLVGDFGIGIAPEAQWISAKYSAGPEGHADIVEAMDFMWCPWDLDGKNRDCNKRPRIVSNSWGLIRGDCSTADEDPFLVMINKWLSAGIFPSFSAGNDIVNFWPAAYPETFETGSVTLNNVRWGYSSVGPSCIVRENRQFPQIMAGGGAHCGNGVLICFWKCEWALLSQLRNISSTTSHSRRSSYYVASQS